MHRRAILVLTLLSTCIPILCLVAAAASNEEVTFPSKGGLMLEGTLRLPNASNKAVPGVVLIHGSGPISRDSVLPGQLNLVFGFAIPVFAEIGNALQDAGIAVLTYDKRSCGTFNNCSNNSYPLPSNNLTINAFVDDALAAVEYLQTREDISDITIVGHSQSGQFVPVMMNTMPTVITSGVLLAGPFHPIDDLIEFQLNSTVALLEEMGVNETAAEPIVAPLVELVQGLENIRNGSEEPVGGVPAIFWQSWFDIREKALDAAANMKQPILVLNGELDWNVPPSEAEAWSDYLNQVAAKYETEIFPCVTHAMNCLAQSDPAKINPVTDIGRNVDPQVTEALIGFVAGYTATNATSIATSRDVPTVMSAIIIAAATFLIHL